ncbi:MAG TPA: efflux RND transporter periplasmic adaptor subunit [Burkholderiales bacterium]|nr:efflux RND transporter periplasmic adaptor subunit [Burkholderiales bacterium]
MIKIKTRWLLLSVAALVLAVGAVLWWRLDKPQVPKYVSERAAKGDVVRTVVTTGSVNPVVTVQVGSYVSGPVQSLYCDFNTKVKAGQLCAKIDPSNYQVAVDQARANLATAKAQMVKDQASLAYAKINYERDRGLVARGIVSQDTVDSDKSAYEQAIAQVKLDEATIEQRRAALAGAEVNLKYTDIVSPVDGVVVSRNVDVGQTVAASFQTPTLFLIAKDLTKMQVDTNVSESDIGAVKLGDRGIFTVEAYPQKTFEGRVTQVRKAPITVQNVVTYDAVISVDNPDLLLLPGMTANAKIVTEERKDVLRVPEQALRFEPGGLGAAKGKGGRGSQRGSQLWVLKDGRPAAVPVTVGLEDGTWAQIAGGKLVEGDAVITDEVSAGGATAARRPALTPFRF